MNAAWSLVLNVMVMIAVAWHPVPQPRASFQGQPPSHLAPAPSRAWEDSVHSLSNLVANFQALDDLLKASRLPEGERSWAMATVGQQLLQDDWMLLCHHDRRLDPEATRQVHAEIDQARKAGQPVIPERVLFRNLRPSAPPRSLPHWSGKSRLELFYEARLKLKNSAGHRQVAEIVRRHCPGLDLSRSGTLQEAWVLTGLLEDLRDERERDRRWHNPSTRESGKGGSNSGYRGQPSASFPGDDPRLAALDRVYRQLFHLRFSRVPGLKDAEALVNELSRVSLGEARDCFWFIPFP